MLAKTTIDIDRKTASKLLNVSVRTIDRYIRRGTLQFREDKGRVWLDKKEVLSLPVSNGMFRRAKVDTIQKRPPLSAASVKQTNEHFYQELYEDARKALGDHQQRLQQANYRIGQLESQNLHNSSLPIKQPIIELPSQSRREDSIAFELLKKELTDREKEITALKNLLQSEKTNRIIFSVITYVFLLLVPLFWYLSR